MSLEEKLIRLMQVAITDANIFIDLFELELLSSFFLLPYDIHTTIFVLEELDIECSQNVQENSTILNINDQQKIEMEDMTWNRGFTFPDKSILFVATKQQMIVLSGEKKMMTWCKTNDLESHGILFIFQKFIEEGVFTKAQMADKLKELMEFNQWLPSDICLDLIEQWSV